MVSNVLSYPVGNSLSVDGYDLVLVTETISANIVTGVVKEETSFNIAWHSPAKMCTDEIGVGMSTTQVGEIRQEHHAIVVGGLYRVAQKGGIDFVE